MKINNERKKFNQNESKKIIKNSREITENYYFIISGRVKRAIVNFERIKEARAVYQEQNLFWTDRKAQLGEGIISFPTLLLVLFIILVFLLISGGLSIFGNSFEKQEPVSVAIARFSFLEKPIEIANDGETKKILIQDAIYLMLRKEIMPETFYESVTLLMNEKDDCFYFDSVTSGVAFYQYKKDFESAIDIIKTSNEHDLQKKIKPVIKLGTKQTFDINEKNIEVSYYYGECPDEIE